jgi:hypothetical protein
LRDWRQWGPYLSDRQWGTVREDYSADGEAWTYLTHDDAIARAYRWGEDGIGGICDETQRLCLGLAVWNGVDPILKERLFGLTGKQGNHGEDVKELYWYLDGVPSHTYLRMLYKYPQRAFPYQQLVDETKRRSRDDPEYKLLDTGVFDEDRYFDIFIEYAKADEADILMRVTATRRCCMCCRSYGSPITGPGGPTTPSRRCTPPARIRCAPSTACWAATISMWKPARSCCSARTRPIRRWRARRARGCSRTASIAAWWAAGATPPARTDLAPRWRRGTPMCWPPASNGWCARGWCATSR